MRDQPARDEEAILAEARTKAAQTGRSIAGQARRSGLDQWDKVTALRMAARRFQVLASDRAIDKLASDMVDWADTMKPLGMDRDVRAYYDALAIEATNAAQELAEHNVRQNRLLGAAKEAILSGKAVDIVDIDMAPRDFVTLLVGDVADAGDTPAARDDMVRGLLGSIMVTDKRRTMGCDEFLLGAYDRVSGMASSPDVVPEDVTKRVARIVAEMTAAL